MKVLLLVEEFTVNNSFEMKIRCYLIDLVFIILSYLKFSVCRKF